MWKNILFIVLGMFLMYIVLKIMSSKVVTTESQVTARLIELLKTGQAVNLIKTNEFREMVKTTEFKNLLSALANDQISAVSKSLVTYEKKC